jgi:hypothetical protein
MNKRIVICYDAVRIAIGFKVVLEGAMKGPQPRETIYGCYTCENARSRLINVVAASLCRGALALLLVKARRRSAVACIFTCLSEFIQAANREAI